MKERTQMCLLIRQAGVSYGSVCWGLHRELSSREQGPFGEEHVSKSSNLRVVKGRARPGGKSPEAP